MSFLQIFQAEPRSPVGTALRRSIVGLVTLAAALGCSGPPEAGTGGESARVSLALAPPVALTISVPNPLSPMAPVLVGSNSVFVGASANISVGTVVAMGSGGVHAEPNALLNETWSRGLADLRDGVQVRGTLHATTRTLGQGTVVNAWDAAPRFDPPSSLTWSVAYPSTTPGPNITVISGAAPKTMAPGQYGTVIVQPSAILNLSTGTYYLASLDAESGAQIKLDQANGPVVIYVQTGLILRGAFVSQSGAPPNLFLGYLGQNQVFVESLFDGALIAPFASLTLRAVNGTHSGFFAAKDVFPDANAKVQYRTPSALVAAAGGAASLPPNVVLPDKIVPAVGFPAPPGGPINPLIAAATTGEAAVGDNGSMSYDVPIWAPDGVGGMRPELSIHYNSQSGQGLLGRRWGITGLSVITRCRKTLADGKKLPIDYVKGDDFCLDGVRMSRSGGSPFDPNKSGSTGNGEFSMPINPFQRITALVGNTISGIQTFRVLQPDGRIFFYGSMNESRLTGTAPTFPDGVAVGSVVANYAFYLDKIQDRFGNSIIIQYSVVPAANGAVKELVPDTIRWGAVGDGVGQRFMRFSYANDADSLHRKYVAGLAIDGGRRVSSINIFGPNGLGDVPLLKSYNFTYTAQTISGEQLLATISECDGTPSANGTPTCKKPTRVQWQIGLPSYVRTDTGITDVALPTLPTPPSGSSPWPAGAYESTYRRILVADINNDGRDDIVYRAVVPSLVAGRTCLGWAVRLSQGTTFGAPFALRMGDDNCGNGPLSSRFPSTGDLVIGDVIVDGYPDIFAPTGSVARGSAPMHTGYQGFRSLYAALPGFSVIDILTGSTGVDLANPGIAAGDIDGDGVPELIRPKVAQPNVIGSVGSLWAATLKPQSPPTLRTIPDIGQGMPGFAGLSVFDIDGDGVVEVLRDTTAGFTYGTSPTVAGIFPIPPQNTRQVFEPFGEQRFQTRFMLDFNGDGLVDIAHIAASVDGLGRVSLGTLSTLVNTGRGFTRAPSADTLLHAGQSVGDGWAAPTATAVEPSARVADVNADGRQDLVLLGNGAATDGPGIATRSNVLVLLSKGDGSFTVQTQSIPVGDPASGYWNFGASPPTVKRGYRTSVVADVNGDGMPDIVQLENGRLVQYVRQGGQPDVVKGIFEGTGRNVTALYASMSDANVYHSDPASCAGDLLHLSCATRGLLLTSTLQVSGDTSAQIEQYTYENGLIARGGHGFLGFKKRDIRTITPPFVRTQILSDPGKLTTVQGFAGYFYPFSFKPSEVRVDVDTGQGANGHYFASTTTLYTVTSQGSTAGSMSLNVLPTTISSDTADCPGTGQCTGPVRFLSRTAVQAEYDALGNITHRTEERRTGSDFLPVQSDTVDTVYYPVDTHWLIGLVKERKHRSATLTRSATRTTRFTPDLTAVNPVTNLRTGQLLQVEFEPDGDESTHSFRNFERDERGRLKTIYDTSPGLREVRTTSYLYEDADGVYATTITNPMGHKQRIYRHPGLGLVVATVDANGAVASATYDSFARPLSETEATGESATVTYKAPPATGVDIEINPEGRSTRTFALHIDPLGNEKTLSMSVDATKKLEVTNVLDPSGRLARRETRSTTATTSTLLNTLTPVFDNLNRLLSSCHFVSSDGTNRCTRYDYDGLTTTTTNEAGRVTTTIVDGMGRPSIQRAALQTGTSNSMFSYGPFGLPETQSVDDGSGGTIFAYDVLGRLLSVYRSGAGIRGTTYNAFGDVVSTYKQGNFDDPPSGIISFGRDKLGRVTTVTSAGSSAPNALPGLNRAFYWDQTAEGAPAPNAIGNLVDMVDAGFRTSVHFDYNALGLPSRKTWKVFNASTDRDELYAASFAYDAQGRLDTLTYPSAPDESAPLAVKYAYDAFTGSASSLSDAANPGSPIWSATARNELGQITNESMTFAGPLVTRVTSYFLQDGRTRSASLIGPTITSPGVISRAQLNYTYQHDGRPATFGTSGTAFLGAWTSTFGHDNLGRLTSWQPDTGAPVVSYRYDGSGSLLSRSWSSGALGETVTYGTTVTARTVTTTGSGGPTSTDAYAFDRFGRVWDTPAISARLTDDDQIGSLTEKDSGRIDTLVYDGFGNRLLTLFDAEGSAGTLLTLGDVFELRRDGSGNPSTAESRCRLRAGGRLIGDIVRVGSGARTATFYLEDNVHSVIAEASSAGVVTRRARRDPYGNAFTSAATPYLPGDPTASDPDGSSRLGFGSHERDADWGIVDMLARAYSPRLGRFLSPDPIIANVLDRREHNPFAYARNDPTNLYDPTGLAVGKYTEVGDDEIDITQIIDRPAKGDEAGSVFEGTTFGVAVQEGVDAVLGGDASSANTNTSSSGGTSGGTSSGTSGGTNGATGGIGGGNTGVGTPGGSGPGGQGGGAGPTGTEPGRGGHAPGPLYEGPGGGISAGRSGAGGRGGHGGTEGHSGHDGTSAAAPNKSMDLEWLSSLSTAVEAGGAFEESFGKKAQNQKMADFGSKAGKVGSKSGVVTAVVKIIDGVRSGNEDAVNDGLASLTASIIAPIIAAKSGGKIGPSGEFLLEQAIEKGAKRIFDNIKVVDPNPNFWRYGQDITHSADPREVF